MVYSSRTLPPLLAYHAPSDNAPRCSTPRIGLGMIHQASEAFKNRNLELSLSRFELQGLLIRRARGLRTGICTGMNCISFQTFSVAFSYSQTLRCIRSRMKSWLVREIGTVLINFCHRSNGVFSRNVTVPFPRDLPSISSFNLDFMTTPSKSASRPIKKWGKGS